MEDLVRGGGTGIKESRPFPVTQYRKQTVPARRSAFAEAVDSYTDTSAPEGVARYVISPKN